MPADDGWTGASQPSFTTTAGELCPFALAGDTLVDQVVEKMLQTFPDGSQFRALGGGT